MMPLAQQITPLTQASATESARSFTSLKWRALLLTSLVLLGLAATYTVLGYQNQQGQFAEHRSALHERQAREFALILQYSQAHLQRLGALLPALANMESALRAGSADHVAAAFDLQWPGFQLDENVQEVQIYDAAGDLLGAWSDSMSISDSAARPPITDWVSGALRSQAPRNALWCYQYCQQYRTVPLLIDGSLGGVAVLSIAFDTIVINTQRLSENAVGLFIADLNTHTGHPIRFLDTWSGRLALLTDAAWAWPVLQQASTLTSIAAMRTAPMVLQSSGETFEISILPLEVETGSRQAQILIVDNITEPMRSIQAGTRKMMGAALSGWLIAELLLLLILWAPLNRLRQLALALPLLAQHRFSIFRSTLPLPPRLRNDEIDALHTASLALADDLESLGQRVRTRDRELSARMVDLSRQRDFVNRLLDAAHVIIVTHDAQGRIDRVNRFGQSITGYTHEELVGTPFRASFMLDSPRPKGLNGQDESALLTDAQGQTRLIDWYHSRVSDPPSADSSVISVGLDVTERSAAEDRLRWLADHDPLTSLCNRRAFHNALEQALSEPQGYGVLLFLDLDQFRNVNDFSGHSLGDQMLMLVADAIIETATDSGLVARLGGDEFAILLQQTHAVQAQALGIRLLQRLQQLALPSKGLYHRITASLGLAQYPEHGRDPADLMANADLAMYRAKSEGPGRWYALPPADNTARENAQERVYWVEYIREALHHGRFDLYAQPIQRVADGQIAGYEILARTKGPDGALLPASRFIPVAENSRQIIDLDFLMVRKSLAFLHHIQASQPGLCFSLNLSSQTLHDPAVFHLIQSEIHRYQIDPSRLTLEVTETDAITDFVKVRTFVQRIRELGCRVALDDFGMGFSSFNYLRELPVNYIKIDGSFIRNIDHHHVDQEIAKAIISVATALGVETVAEFVHNAAIMDFIRANHVTYAQGYHIGRPTPVHELFPLTPSDTPGLSWPPE